MSFDSSKKQWIFMAAGAAAALAVTLVLLNKRREEEEEEEEKQKKRKKFTGEYDLPPFHWETTVKQIEADSKKVLADAAAVLDAVANASEPLTYEKVVLPLQLAPNYKTNPLVCQSKFLQHCSTDSDLRDAAEAAGKLFATFKAESRRRADVFAKVQAYAETAEARGLGFYEKHFLDSLLADFRRGGLGLPTDGARAKLQRLLDEDTACCSKYKTNLGEDATALYFDPADLEGMPQAFIEERLVVSTPGDHEGGGVPPRVRLTLKYPDLIPVLSNCAVAATRRLLTMAREGGQAYKDNLELVAEGIKLRKQTASLLVRSQ